MKPPTRISLPGAVAAARRIAVTSTTTASRRPAASLAPTAIQQHQHHQQWRLLHVSTPATATVHPISGTGPPPKPPMPASSAAEGVYGDSSAYARVAKRRKQAELLKRARELRSTEAGKGKGNRGQVSGGLRRRFWKDVRVKEADGAYEIYLDTRLLRHPTNKKVVRVPLSKPQLAFALALEWDQLESAQQATMQHLIPLTGLVCRALDIWDDDAEHSARTAAAAAADTAAPATPAPIRAAITAVLLRYLDTDSLLCWAPAPTPLRHPSVPSGAGQQQQEVEAEEAESLRALQERTAAPIVSYLTNRVWPGVRIQPVLEEGGGLLPRPQAPGVRDVVRGWLLGLDAWDLAGVERATLAGKGLLGAARLVAEWSEGPVLAAASFSAPSSSPSSTEAGTVEDGGQLSVFGVEEAARAASVEVDWQTRKWGEVEDTHDVEKEDLRRQLGSVVLLVAGDGKST